MTAIENPVWASHKGFDALVRALGAEEAQVRVVGKRST